MINANPTSPAKKICLWTRFSYDDETASTTFTAIPSHSSAISLYPLRIIRFRRRLREDPDFRRDPARIRIRSETIDHFRIPGQDRGLFPGDRILFKNAHFAPLKIAQRINPPARTSAQGIFFPIFFSGVSAVSV